MLSDAPLITCEAVNEFWFKKTGNWNKLTTIGDGEQSCVAIEELSVNLAQNPVQQDVFFASVIAGC